MQETKLALAECSCPPLHDEVSDGFSYDFYDFYVVVDDDDDMHSYHDSPVWPKWDEKTIQAADDLVGDPLDSRKTRSQFHNALSTCELNLSDL